VKALASNRGTLGSLPACACCILSLLSGVYVALADQNPTVPLPTAEDPVRLTPAASTVRFGPSELRDMPPIKCINWLAKTDFLVACTSSMPIPDPAAAENGDIENSPFMVPSLHYYHLDVDDHRLQTLGEQQCYHDLLKWHGWRIGHAADSFLLFPHFPPEMFAPQEPVYRYSSSGAFSVQPYRAVGSKVLSPLRFVVFSGYGGDASVHIVDGHNQTISEAHLANAQTGDVSSLKEVALAETADGFCALAGVPDSDGGWVRLAVANIRGTGGQVTGSLRWLTIHEAASSVRIGAEPGEWRIVAGTSRVFSPSLAGQTCAVFFWTTALYAQQGESARVEVCKCFRLDAAGKTELIYWYAVKADAKEDDWDVLLPHEADWNHSIPVARSANGELDFPQPSVCCSPDGGLIALTAGDSLLALELGGSRPGKVK